MRVRAETKGEDEKDRDLFGRLPEVARCLFCPDWQFEGTASECAEAQLDHRRQQHPETLVPRKKAAYGGKGAKPCKLGDCMKPAVTNRGRWAGLCAQHRDALKEQTDERASERRGGRHGAVSTHQGRLITPEIRGEIVRLYVEERLSCGEIGRRFFRQWGYRSDKSLQQTALKVLHDANVLIERERSSSRRRRQERLGEARVEVAWRLYEAGCSIQTIAALAAPRWGYTNTVAFTRAIAAEFKERGHTLRMGRSRAIPDVSRSEAVALIEEVT